MVLLPPIGHCGNQTRSVYSSRKRVYKNRLQMLVHYEGKGRFSSVKTAGCWSRKAKGRVGAN